MPQNRAEALSVRAPRKCGRLLVALLLFLLVFLFSACSADDEPTGALRVSVNKEKGYCSITGIGSYTGKHIAIPDEHDGLPIKYINKDAFAESDVETIVISDNIIAIEAGAFRDCKHLTRVSVASSASKISRIGEGAFDGTPYINEDSRGDWENGVLYLGRCVVAAAPELSGEVRLRDGTYTIAHQAFRGTSITKITLPAGLYHCGDYTFYECTSLRCVEFLGSVGYFGTGLFYGCAALEEFTVPVGCVNIGANAFAKCTSLRRVTFADDKTALIKKGAFADCTSLAEMHLPSSVKTIEEEAFRSCTALQKISGAASLSEIKDKAFFGCRTLKVFSLPTEAVSCGALVFYGTPLAD